MHWEKVSGSQKPWISVLTQSAQIYTAGVFKASERRLEVYWILSPLRLPISHPGLLNPKRLSVGASDLSSDYARFYAHLLPSGALQSLKACERAFD